MIGVKNNNDGGGFRKVTLREEKLIGFVADIADIQTLLDDFSESVATGEILVLLVAHYQNNVDGEAMLSRFIFKNNQATTIFSPANPILEGNLIPMGGATIGHIMSLPASQLIELGELNADSVSDVLNAENPLVSIQDGGIVVVHCTILGVDTFYLFFGEGGDYGATGLQSVDGDFVLLGQGDTENFWTKSPTGSLQNTVPAPVRHRGAGSGSQPNTVILDANGNITAYFDNAGNLYTAADIIARQHIFTIGNPQSQLTDNGGSVGFRVKATGVWEVQGLINDQYDPSANYDDSSHVNLGYVKKRNGHVEFSFTLNQNSVEQPNFRIINNPTNILNEDFSIGVEDVGHFSIFTFTGAPFDLDYCFPVDGEKVAFQPVFSTADGSPQGFYQVYCSGTNELRVKTYDLGGQLADGIIKKAELLTIKMFNQ